MVTIEHTGDASDKEWDDHWYASTSATYYHSREWAELWTNYTNGIIRPVPKIITFSDNKTVILPIMQQRYYGGTIRRYGLCGPPSEATAKYGNWLCSEELSSQHIKQLINYILSRYKNLVWQMNPYDNNHALLLTNGTHIRRKYFKFFMIDLTKGEKQIYSGLEQNCRNKIMQGVKNNLEIREGIKREEWLYFYEMYKDTIARWGKKVLFEFRWEFFDLLLNTYCNNRKLWLTWHKSLPISGCICFYTNNKIMLFQSASLTDYQHLRPVNLEKYFIIKDGIKNGYQWLDLGTAGKNKGLERFKKSFGPEEIQRDMVISWHPLYKIIKNFTR